MQIRIAVNISSGFAVVNTEGVDLNSNYMNYLFCFI